MARNRTRPYTREHSCATFGKIAYDVWSFAIQEFVIKKANEKSMETIAAQGQQL